MAEEDEQPSSLLDQALGEAGWDRVRRESKECNLDGFLDASLQLLDELNGDRLWILDDHDVAAIASDKRSAWSRFVDPALSRTAAGPLDRHRVVLWECSDHMLELRGIRSSWELFQNGQPTRPSMIVFGEETIIPEDDPYEPEEQDEEPEMTIAEREHLLGRAQVAEGEARKARQEAALARQDLQSRIDADRREHEAKLQKFERDLSSTRTELEQLRHQRRLDTSSNTRVALESEAELTRLLGLLSAAQEELLGQRAELESVRSELDRANVEGAAAADRADDLERALAGKADRLVEAINERITAQHDVARQGNALVDLQAQLANTQAQLANTQAQLARQASELAEAQIALEPAVSDRQRAVDLQAKLNAVTDLLQVERLRAEESERSFQTLQHKIDTRLPRRYRRRLESAPQNPA